MKTKTDALGSIVEGMRGYFLTTNLDEQSGDGEKWTEHANRLYDIVEAGRKDRGLPVGLADVHRGAKNLLVFEEPNYCLARDAGAYAYNLHFWDDGHARDLPLLFRFAGPEASEAVVGQASGRQEALADEDFKRSDQFIQAFLTFARTGQPQVSGA